jgi:hypothetical protein
MASRIPDSTPIMDLNDDDQLPPIAEQIPVSGDVTGVPGGIRYGKGTQPVWMKYWPYVLVAWALWFAYIGADQFYHFDYGVNYFFTGLIIVWTIYHLLAPYFKWPALPLG